MPTFNAGKRFRLAILALLCLFELPCCLSSISRVLVDEEQLLLFYGTLLNDMGSPIPGAQIQFWQTDQHGQYDHPQSASNTESLDPDFQYFGTATTLDDGSFWFRTQRPGLYTQRPVTHIHFKVWVNGVDILTSQFYFADENTSFSSLLQLELEELVTDDSSPGSTTYVTNKTIVVASGLGGDFGPLTPSQPAGPFYPVVDFFSFDSDLVNIATPAVSTLPSSAPTTMGPISLRIQNSGFEKDNNKWKEIRGNPIRECNMGSEWSGDCAYAFYGASGIESRIKNKAKHVEGGSVGDIFTLSFYAKGVDVPTKNALKAFVKIKGSQPTRAYGCKSSKRGTFEYTKMSCSFTIDRDFENMSIEFSYRGSTGSLYLDRIGLEVLYATAAAP